VYPTLGAAYRLKELFNDLWSMRDKEAANAFLQDWCAQVEQAKIPALQKFANTVRAHWSGSSNRKFYDAICIYVTQYKFYRHDTHLYDVIPIKTVSRDCKSWRNRHSDVNLRQFRPFCSFI
jgi:Transposase